MKRTDSFYLVLLGACVFLSFGLLAAVSGANGAFDFKCLYFGSRCLIEGHDPYQPNEVKAVLHREGGEDAQDTEATKIVKSRFNNLPSIFVVMAPLAFLPYKAALTVWLTGMSMLYVAAAFFIWHEAARYAPAPAGILVFLALAMNELSFAMANAAVYAVPLCVIAVCCFLRDRYVRIGMLCLAISLMFKPHDGGLILLFLMMSGGKCRAYAWKSALLAALLSIVPVTYLTFIAPHWPTELLASLHAYAAHGDVNDPGPAGMTAESTVMITSLQALLSLILDRPFFYNGVTYLACGLFLVPLAVRWLKEKFSAEGAWLVLAPVSAFTLLVVYHRIYDGRILLLAVPACALLWRRSQKLGAIAAALLAAGTVVTDGLFWSIFAQIVARHPGVPLFAPGCLRWMVAATPPLVLLVTGGVFLRLYLRTAQSEAS